METLIEDLLALARRDGELAVEPTSLEAVARDAWEQVATGDATLSVAVGDATVAADRDRLARLFENVFRNSVEHGGEDVAVTVTDLPDGAGFAVVDDDPGFAAADVDAVFEDGYTTSPEGTGYGLSIVAEIADLHGWSVDAATADGGGARIEVRTAGVDADVDVDVDADADADDVEPSAVR